MHNHPDRTHREDESGFPGKCCPRGMASASLLLPPKESSERTALPCPSCKFSCSDLGAVNIDKRRGRKRRLSYLMPFQKALPLFKSPKLTGNALLINPH